MTRQNITPANVLHVTFPALDKPEHVQNGKRAPGILPVNVTSPPRAPPHFPVPANPAMRRFSEITVLELPDIQHRFVAPRIAIQ